MAFSYGIPSLTFKNHYSEVIGKINSLSIDEYQHVVSKLEKYRDETILHDVRKFRTHLKEIYML